MDNQAADPAPAADPDLVEAGLDLQIAVDIPDYRRAAARQLQLWRGRLDDLRVQAQLARMEAGDDLDERIHDVEKAYEAARGHLEALGDDASERFGTIRDSIASLLDDISVRAETLAERLRHEQIPPAR